MLHTKRGKMLTILVFIIFELALFSVIQVAGLSIEANSLALRVFFSDKTSHTERVLGGQYKGGVNKAFTHTV
jgi:hypothetical protein